MALNFSFSIGKLPNYVERSTDGSYWYSFLDNVLGKKTKGFFTNEANKLDMVLRNPAALKVLKFNADTGALGKINLVTDTEELVDWLYSYRKQPNPHQTWTELIWEYFFWVQFGRACFYADNKVMYFLNPAKIELTTKQENEFKKLSLSDRSARTLKDGTFKYCQDNGTKLTLELKNLFIINEMAGITGDWFKGASSLDSLYQVCKNSEIALKSKGSNLLFTDKFLVSGQTSASDTSKLPMSEQEKTNVEQSFKGGRQIYANKTNLNVKQMIDNLANLKLDEHYLNDLHIIGNMFGVPKDVLEALGKSATYENQEKALGRHVDYNLLPKGQKFTDLLEVILEEPYLRFSYKHLSFNQVFEKERQEARKVELENLEKAKNLGLNDSVIAKELNKLYEQS